MGDKILVVDDDSQIRDLLKVFLEGRGYTVLTSANGWDCLKDIATYQPDLLILDIRMPKIDGLAVLDMLKVGGLLKDIPIMMVTGVQEVDTILTAAKFHTDEFVIKPFDLEDLAERIAKHLFRIDFGGLVELTSRLRPVDEGYFQPTRVPVAGESAKGFSFYLTMQGKTEIVVAVNRSLALADFVKLPAEQAARDAQVFIRLTTKWKRVWPTRENKTTPLKKVA